jgi:acyl transferase domain-containing protein
MNRTWSEPVAIIGMSCRFGGGMDDVHRYWNGLLAGIDAVTPAPADRWDAAHWFSADPAQAGKITSQHGSWLQDIDRFDHALFRISPAEAPSLDPQLRLLLEGCWHAMEDAAAPPASLRGKETGVYMGISGHEYQVRTFGVPERIDTFSMVGTAPSTMAGRISYAFGLTGPNLAVDTACSSGLTALHLACQALLGGECDVALAGAANAVLEPETMVYFSRTRMLSPTGRSRPFSCDADGYVRGEGCGVVVLKRLSDALRDQDRIHAVLRGSGLAQGERNGLTAPSTAGQEAAIRKALQRAGLQAQDIGYVECHAVGAPLADALEAGVLSQCLAAHDRPPLRIGSVKSNLGHTESASGLAGLLKVVLALQHGVIPATLHVGRAAEGIDASRLQVVSQPQPWDTPRIAGVSAFGFGGTNAHVIVQEPPTHQPRAGLGSYRILALSAPNEPALRAQAASVADWIESHPEQDPADLCYSMSISRAMQSHRMAFVWSDAHAAMAALKEVAGGGRPAGVHMGHGRAKPAESSTLAAGSEADAWAASYAQGQPLPSQQLAGRWSQVPGYVFQRERHWLERPAQPWATAPARVEAQPDRWLSVDQIVRAEACRILKCQEIADDALLPELGLDSLTALELQSALESRLGWRLPAGAVWQQPTIAGLLELASSQGRAGQGELRQSDAGQGGAHCATIGRRSPVQADEPTIDAAAVVSLPSGLLEGASFELRASLMEAAHRMFTLEGERGRIGVVSAPIMDRDLYADPQATRRAIEQACELAHAAGAQSIALTGLIPSATAYGQSLQGPLVMLTTGHSTTVACVVQMVRSIEPVLGRKLVEERMAFLGLGSIGEGVARLCAARLPAPASLLLVDVPSRRMHLEALRHDLQAWCPNVRIVVSEGPAPGALYDCSLIVSATSMPGVVEVDRLGPGTLVIDDSAPHCLSVDDAWRRMQSTADLLVTEAGTLQVPERLRCLPGRIWADSGDARFAAGAALLNPAADLLMGCVYSSLLTLQEGLDPVLGLPTPSQAATAWDVLERLGARAAPMSLEGRMMPASLLERMKRFSSSQS